MIEYLLISNIDGLPLFHRNYSSKEQFTELLSGFFSAADFFSTTQMEKRLEQIQLEDRYITFRKEVINGSGILFVLISQHCLGSSNQNDCICVPSTLEDIQAEFRRRFGNENLQGVINTGLFRDFCLFVDSVVERHFKAHCFIDNFVKDFGSDRKAKQDLLGFVSFKNGTLLNYHLVPGLSHLRYQKLLSSTKPWQKLFKSGDPYLARQLSYLDGFNSMMSFLELQNGDRIHLFTFWKPEVGVELINDLHDSVQLVLGYTALDGNQISGVS